MNPVTKKSKPNHNDVKNKNDSNQNPQEQDDEDGEPQKSIEESITNQLKNRMLVSGEWLRLQKVLMVKLRGSEWEQNLRCEAEGRALDKDSPTLSKLITHLRPIAQNTIPTEIKQEISASISKFIKANVEEDDHDGEEDDDEDDDAMEEVV